MKGEMCNSFSEKLSLREDPGGMEHCTQKLAQKGCQTFPVRIFKVTSQKFSSHSFTQRQTMSKSESSCRPGPHSVLPLFSSPLTLLWLR